jgi:hypothetical protein
MLEDRVDFDWWNSVIIPPRDVAKQIRSKLIESMRGDSTGLDPQLDGEGLSMKRRSSIRGCRNLTFSVEFDVGKTLIIISEASAKRSQISEVETKWRAVITKNEADF